MYINYLLIQIYFLFIQTIVYSIPIYNPSTRCHQLILENENRTVAICFQRASDKQHPFNRYTSIEFCSKTYPSNGHLIDLVSLSEKKIEFILKNLVELINSTDASIALPLPNFLWIGSNYTDNLVNNSFWCSNKCQSKKSVGKFLILDLQCEKRPCLTTKNTHWDRAPFMCLIDGILPEIKSVPLLANAPAPTYTNTTIVFNDSTPCVIVRTNTHQYTFCFRRQVCPQAQRSAFCTNKSTALKICQEEKNSSNLLTIENDDEYQLINDVLTVYSDETLLDKNGTLKSKYITRAQWMWIDGTKGLKDIYRWNRSGQGLTDIEDKYWCETNGSCLGGKGRDHVVLNIVCQLHNRNMQTCLASRRQSEPGPFICKRRLTANEESISKFVYLKNIKDTPPSTIMSPVYEKDSTSIYYDEDHCLTVQSRTHLYTFCLRRQECFPRKAYCTKWSQAQQKCQLNKNNSQLLTIDNQAEQTLINDIIERYHEETRLTFNGSSYQYFQLADFLWIDGIQQRDNQTYLWKNGQEKIPDRYWCPKSECTSVEHPRVMLNLLCRQNRSVVCLGTRLEWKPAPYACKRIRSIDICPILFDGIRSIKSNEMLVVTVNRTITLIKCKHPDYNTQIKVQYQCEIKSKQWKLIYQNPNFICPGYEIIPLEIVANRSIARKLTTTTFSTSLSNISISDCPQTDIPHFVAQLPTQSRYVYSTKFISQPTYYDLKLTCAFNSVIQITYRCDLHTKKWFYVYGNSRSFDQCYPTCYTDERQQVLNKYFSPIEQQRIRSRYLERKQSIVFRCYNSHNRCWKTIVYKCGTNTITKQQWFKIHSCFQQQKTLPDVTVSMSVTQLPAVLCPPTPVSSCLGEYIKDTNGCMRKICPSTSQLCHTIRCPSDRICRVITCPSCVHTNYLQAVCEPLTTRTLCEFQEQLIRLNDFQSIDHWEQQAMIMVQRYASDQRQRLRSISRIN